MFFACSVPLPHQAARLKLEREYIKVRQWHRMVEKCDTACLHEQLQCTRCTTLEAEIAFLRAALAERDSTIAQLRWLSTVRPSWGAASTSGILFGHLVEAGHASYGFLLRCSFVCLAWHTEIAGQMRLLRCLYFPAQPLWRLKGAQRVDVVVAALDRVLNVEEIDLRSLQFRHSKMYALTDGSSQRMLAALARLPALPSQLTTLRLPATSPFSVASIDEGTADSSRATAAAHLAVPRLLASLTSLQVILRSKLQR